MVLRKRNIFLNLVNSYLIDSPQPSSISYLWNFGSLLGVMLVIQIVTGVTLAMHYTPHVSFAFNSVEHIMRDVSFGWFIRYAHANGASFFFIFVYLHMARGLYYGSYKSPRGQLWAIGVIIFLLMIITAFLGYVLPYGQMSLWGATVITNLMSAIPFLGQDIVQFLWGGFSVGNPTLNRFFALHYLLPFILAALIVMHFMALHQHGSSNPLGITGNLDRLPIHPYFMFKDLVTIFAFMFVFSIYVFYKSNALGHPDNYIMANPMSTPASIVPEWYLLPFYAILRSIPDKLGGVIAMVAAILILLAMPVVDNNTIRGNAFRAGTKVLMGIFFANFLLLGVLGQEHVEAPFIEVGQVSTGLYFLFYIFLLPLITECETLFSDMYSLEQGTYSTKTISSEINTDKLSDNFIINKLSLVI